MEKHDFKEIVDEISLSPKSVMELKNGNSIYFYESVPVHHINGVRLLIDNNKPLRASRINVYTDQIKWHCGYPHEIITTPTGRNIRSGPGWKYPGNFELGIVLFNAGIATQIVKMKNDPIPQEILLNKDSDIIVNVNDGTGRPAYTDNKGSFDIYIILIKAI